VSFKFHKLWQLIKYEKDFNAAHKLVDGNNFILLVKLTASPPEKQRRKLSGRQRKMS